ncbi:hypothetical protein V5O48_015251 [Marasmius crinis-equi]|uniref:Uncharacterized protein n=1 Tax=Marasmius crinis-equi TaxID=585013 RepID=A0ABR3EV23_9AGAR
MPIEPNSSLKKASPGLSKHVSLLHPQLCFIYFYLCVIVWRQTRKLLFALVSPDPPPSNLDNLVNLSALADLATLVHRIWKPWSAKTWPSKKHFPLIPPFVVTMLASAEFVARLYHPSMVEYTFQLAQEFLTMPINDPLQDLIKPLQTKPGLAYRRFNLYKGSASWIPLMDIYMHIFHLEVAIPLSKSDYSLDIESVTMLHICNSKPFPSFAVASDDTSHIFRSDLGKIDLPKELEVEQHPPTPEDCWQGHPHDLSPSAGLVAMLPDVHGPYSAYLKDFSVLPFFLPTPDADNNNLVMASYDNTINAQLLYGGILLVSDYLVPLLKVLVAKTAVGIEAQEIVAPDTTTVVQMVAGFGPKGFAPLKAVDIPWYTKTRVCLCNPKAEINIATFLSAPPLEDVWLTAGILPPHTGGLAPHPDDIPTLFHDQPDTTYKTKPSASEHEDGEFAAEDKDEDTKEEEEDKDNENTKPTKATTLRFKSKVPSPVTSSDKDSDEDDKVEEVDKIISSDCAKSPNTVPVKHKKAPAPTPSNKGKGKAVETPAPAPKKHKQGEATPEPVVPSADKAPLPEEFPNFEDLLNSIQHSLPSEAFGQANIPPLRSSSTLSKLYQPTDKSSLKILKVNSKQYWKAFPDTMLSFHCPKSPGDKKDTVILFKPSGHVCSHADIMKASKLGPSFGPAMACEQCVNRGIPFMSNHHPSYRCGPCRSSKLPCSHVESVDMLNLIRDQMRPLVSVCPTALGDEVIALIRQGELAKQMIANAELAREAYFESFDRFARKLEDPLVLFSTIRAAGGRVKESDFDFFAEKFNWSMFKMEEVDTVRAAYQAVGPLPPSSDSDERRAWESELAEAMKSPEAEEAAYKSKHDDYHFERLRAYKKTGESEDKDDNNAAPSVSASAPAPKKVRQQAPNPGPSTSSTSKTCKVSQRDKATSSSQPAKH